MSKKAIWITAIILIVLISIPATILGILYYNYTWALEADFDQYSEHFIAVKDYITSEFPNETHKLLSVSIKDQSATLYDMDADEYLCLPDDIALSLDMICRYGFPHKDSDFDLIRIQGNRITFLVRNGSYALVYSPDEKPTWLNSPDESKKIRVKSIQDGWYHITNRG